MELVPFLLLNMLRVRTGHWRCCALTKRCVRCMGPVVLFKFCLVVGPMLIMCLCTMLCIALFYLFTGTRTSKHAQHLTTRVCRLPSVDQGAGGCSCLSWRAVHTQLRFHARLAMLALCVLQYKTPEFGPVVKFMLFLVLLIPTALFLPGVVIGAVFLCTRNYTFSSHSRRFRLVCQVFTYFSVRLLGIGAALYAAVALTMVSTNNEEYHVCGGYGWM